MTSPPARRWTDLAGGFSVGAGLVHAAAAGTHADDRTLVALFAMTALVQVALGAALLLSASRRTVLAGIAVNLGAVAAWAASRTVGLSVVDSLAGREAVGLQDAAAAALAAASVLVSALALRSTPDEATSRRRLAWLPMVAMVPALLGVAAPHAHDGDHAHADGSDEVAHTDTSAEADHDHDHDDAGAPAATSGLAADPLLVGADTTGVTEAQLQTAVDLVERTRAGASAALTTVEAAEAAGYVWIGDGRRVGGFQHWVNPALSADGATLDPDAVESLVFEHTASGPVLVSAMYILGPGTTMADVPDVAGDLTTWHDHQNLCWDPTGGRLAGVLVNGVCRPGGELRATSPMLHVWLDDHDCGPFAGIEGHGAGCDAHGH